MATMFNIEIFDNVFRRRNSFVDACKSFAQGPPVKSARSEPATPHPEVYDDQTEELIEIGQGTCLVFLHLSSHQKRSEDFWKEKLQRKERIAVITYTAGEPPDFRKPDSFSNDDWHIYLYKISDASQLNLALFFRKWSENIKNNDDRPPLHLLQVWPSLPQAFDILRVGFLTAFEGAGVEGFEKLPEVLRERVRSKQGTVSTPGWWKPALGDNLKGEKLKAAILGDKQKMVMVQGLVSLFENDKQPSPDEIRKALTLESGSEVSKS